MHPQLRIGGMTFGPFIFADADVKMPSTEVDRQITVIQTDALGLVRGFNLPGCSLDQDAENNVFPNSFRTRL